MSLLKAANEHCRWPIDGRGKDGMPRCCGAVAEVSYPYCVEHARIAFVTPVKTVQQIAGRGGTVMKADCGIIDWQARAAALRIELDEALETIRQLKADNTIEELPEEARAELGLSPSECKILMKLLNNAAVTNGSLLAVTRREGLDPEPDAKVVCVYVSKLRERLKPYDVTINRIFRSGYRLIGPDKEKLRLKFLGVH